MQKVKLGNKTPEIALFKTGISTLHLTYFCTIKNKIVKH